MDTKVQETHLYGIAKLPGDPPRAEVRFHPDESAPPGPDLVDYEIQDERFRERLDEREGWISIAVCPGEEKIGELYVNVQFEGPRGDPDRCMGEQNMLLQEASVWLKEFLEKMSPEGAKWNLRFDAQPCPKSTVALAIDEVVNVLDPSHFIEQVQVKPIVGPVVETKRQ